MVQRDIPAEKQAIRDLNKADAKMLRDGYYETVDGMDKLGRAQKKVSAKTKLFGMDHVAYIKAKQAFDKIRLGEIL